MLHDKTAIAYYCNSTVGPKRPANNIVGGQIDNVFFQDFLMLVYGQPLTPLARFRFTQLNNLKQLLERILDKLSVSGFKALLGIFYFILKRGLF